MDNVHSQFEFYRPEERAEGEGIRLLWDWHTQLVGAVTVETHTLDNVDHQVLQCCHLGCLSADTDLGAVFVQLRLFTLVAEHVWKNCNKIVLPTDVQNIITNKHTGSMQLYKDICKN